MDTPEQHMGKGDTELLQAVYGDDIKWLVNDEYVRCLVRGKVLGEEIPGEDPLVLLAYDHASELGENRTGYAPPLSVVTYALELCEVSIKKELERG